MVEESGPKGKEESQSEEQPTFTLNRRTLLQSTLVGSAILGGVGLATPVARQVQSDEKGPGDSSNRTEDFPPSGITEYGRKVTLGNGEVRTFTSETPSGEPRYHGVEFDHTALEGLPSETEISEVHDPVETDKYRFSGQAATIHFKQSLQFFVPFPDATGTPFTFLGLNWNPDGHFGGKGAWEKPHFDIHFHMRDPATVDNVEGPQLPPYDIKTVDGIETNFDFAQLPEGYARPPPPVADERYITDMGEHVAPNDAPELPSGPDDRGDPTSFSNTLIQGFIGDTERSQLAFVEPMLTREFLSDFRGSKTYDVPQPDEYPHDQQHPHEYSVRDIPSQNKIVVVIQTFKQVSD
jgi:hypothetical protein